jgi:hypothetical protein
MSADYSRPSRFARWGWGWAAFCFLGGLANIIHTFQEPSGLRIALCLFTLAATTFCLVTWRQGVRLDREHRAHMARLFGRLYGHEAQQ